MGIFLMFLFTWPIDLANAGILPFKVPFAVYILLGHGFLIATVFMTWITLGREDVVILLKRFLIWRVNWVWYLAALLLLPVIQLAAVYLTAVLNGTAVDYSSVMIYEIFAPSVGLPLLVIPWFLFDVFTNGEEIGWRGYVLPRLQTSHNALVSSLVVGLIWSFWHIPKFLGTGASNGLSFGWFVVAHLALAVLFTWLYNNTRGSLLLVTLFHASDNTAGMFLPAPYASTGGIMDNLLIILYVLAAIIVTAAAGPEHLSRRFSRQVQEEYPVNYVETRFESGV
jgi:membrane protease YdiL (CAAX protease family)